MYEVLLLVQAGQQQHRQDGRNKKYVYRTAWWMVMLGMGKKCHNETIPGLFWGRFGLMPIMFTGEGWGLYF